MKKFLLALLALLVWVPMYAQDSRVTVGGTVIDADGMPVIGASVIVKEHPDIGTITDVNGEFSIKVPAPIKGQSLEVSFIGYTTQKIAIGTKTQFKVTLKEDTQLLNEVVVVGYGTQKKANLTGAVSTVDMG